MDGAAIPAFALEGGLVLALVRGLSVAALLSVFGALLFRAALAPKVLAALEPGAAILFRRRWQRLLTISWGVAMAATLLWLLEQSIVIAGATMPPAAAVTTVLTETSFGHILGFRLVVLAVLPLVLGQGQGQGPGRLWLATAGAATATALQAGHSHAAAMDGGFGLLLVSAAVHLLAAGAWLGGLLPLLLLVAVTPAPLAAQACRRFSLLGTVGVALLASTAIIQFQGLIGGLPGLVGTGYGLVAVLKIGLFAALLGLAARNRFRHTPALTASPSAGTAALRRTIAIEAGTGLLVVLAAGLLTGLPPSMHVQPLWPFAQRLSLDAVREDPDLRMEAILAALAAAGAVVLLVVAILYRRPRWPAVAAAVAVLWFAAPHGQVLLADAYPTSFYRSPTGFAAETILAGARLYPDHCASCHGAEGRGDGPAAATTPVPPADLTANHLWMHSDGELFWWLSHGIEAPRGGLAMPGFVATLSEDQRWALIDDIRAHNAGLAAAGAGTWPQPIQAPGFDADCAGTPASLAGWRGRFVRLNFGVAPRPAGVPGVIDVLAGPRESAPPGFCTVADEGLPQAYRIVTGLRTPIPPGAQFLIDAQGWIRAQRLPGDPADWNDPVVLAALIADLRAHPVAATAPGGHMDMPM